MTAKYPWDILQKIRKSIPFSLKKKTSSKVNPFRRVQVPGRISGGPKVNLLNRLLVYD